MSVFFVKVPPKSYFQSITEEPKYQAKALTVVTDTIETAGAAVVVTIPSNINSTNNTNLRNFNRRGQECVGITRTTRTHQVFYPHLKGPEAYLADD